MSRSSNDVQKKEKEYKYEVTIRFQDKDLKDILQLSDYEHKRSVSKTEEGKVLIKAKDATALRATIDGYIKALKVYETTKEFLN